jgi:hypothetical protein
VDSVKDAVDGAHAHTKAKQSHSLGVLLDGFQDKVAHIQEQEHDRMKVFEEIRSSGLLFM